MTPAESLARALRGRRVGAGWMARCPVHHDENPSLSIHERHRLVLLHCHAGCAQHEVIAALRARGLWGRNTRDREAERKKGDGQAAAEEMRRAAGRIWQASRAAEGTTVETYLLSRGLIVPLPPALRYHPALRHRSGGNWPAMVAAVTRGTDNAFLGVHRTYLDQQGTGKAPVEPQKMMLGPCRGGAVRLASAADVLMVGEGIETCLAAMQSTGIPVWAALSTSGLRALDLPEEIREVIVLADGDRAGEVAAQTTALRWKRQGRRVRIARPPEGMDFNDLLMTRGGDRRQSDGL